ncbi:hypothetical protein Gotur_033673 [Gossypium turneri]
MSNILGFSRTLISWNSSLLSFPTQQGPEIVASCSMNLLLSHHQFPIKILAISTSTIPVTNNKLSHILKICILSTLF